MYKRQILLSKQTDECTKEFFLPLLANEISLPAFITPSLKNYKEIVSCIDEADEICKTYPKAYQFALKSQLFRFFYLLILNVCDKYGITREELDEFSANSQQKCEKAIAEGKFDDEIVPVPVKVKKEIVDFVKDEGPRAGTTAESLAKLKCCSGKEGGLVTAGNASGINDGAAAIVVMSEEKAKELGVTPMATWVAGALGGVEPEIMGVGPVASTRKVLAKTGLSIDDMDLIEANEAFAAQSIAVARDLKFDMSKVNVNGGAIALGHPVGASGCRILVTLLHEMQKRDAKRGLATLCIGGGMGCSTIVER